jgi:hypothetical protein
VHCVLYFLSRPFDHCGILGHEADQAQYLSTQTYVILRFQAILCSCVYPSLSAKEGPGEHLCGIGLCGMSGHSPRQPRRVTVWSCTFGAMIQCTSVDMSKVVPCWYHGNVEHCLRL